MCYDRVAIFCFYDKQGLARQDIFDLLKELKKNVDLLIVVVNGQIKNKSSLSSIADDILIRDNCGFDAGAYRRVIVDEKYASIIKVCNELVLCNSSFFGPLIPLSNIFKTMAESTADFWGISSFAGDLMEHIQSFFLVFRKSVLCGETFFRYFFEHIQEDSQDYLGVCASFENGLYECLVDAGYLPDAFVKNISYDIYTNPYGSLAADGVPIIKKKIFSQQYFEEAKALDTLSYVRDNYKYDIGVLLQSVKQIYGIPIALEAVKTHIRGTVSVEVFPSLRKKKKEEIKQFVHDNSAIYIYGTGEAGRGIYITFFSYENNSKLNGFIVSDEQEIEEKTLFGYPVYRIRDIDKSTSAIIVGLGKENSKMVMDTLREWKAVIYKWDKN
jgi:Lipopolysaccharide biosynthesis protein